MSLPIKRLNDEYALSVLSRASELAKSTKHPPLINMGVGQPDFLVDEHIREAAAKAARDIPFGYAPAMGRPEVREAIAEYCCTTLGYDVDSRCVIVTPGGKGAIFMVMTGLLCPNDEVLIPAPAFPAYASCAEFASAKTVSVPLASDNLTIRAADYIPYLSEHTRLVVVNSPGNPTGGMMPESEVRALARALESYQKCSILADEVYSRQTLSTIKHFSCYKIPSWRNRLFVVDSLSKNFSMTGWRFGWVIFPNGKEDMFNRYAINSYSNLPGVVEYAAKAALQGPQDGVLARTYAYRQRAETFYGTLNDIDQLTCHMPQGAFYCYVDATKFAKLHSINDRQLTDKLALEAGILAIPGFGFNQPDGCFVRFSLAVSDEHIAESCQRLISFFDTPS